MSETEQQRQVLRIHGRTHLPGGSDPILGIGGLQYGGDDTPTYGPNNVGDWLSVEASGIGGTVNAAIAFIIDNNGGFYVNDNGDGGININDHGAGGVQIQADGSGPINLFNEGGPIKLETTDEHEIELQSAGGIALQDTNTDGDGGISLEVQVGNFITFAALPTSDPGVSGAIWNSSGTLKIST